MKMYLGAHESRYSLSIEKPGSHVGDHDRGEYVQIQILYRDDAEGKASSASISVKTSELQAALKAFEQ